MHKFVYVSRFLYKFCVLTLSSHNSPHMEGCCRTYTWKAVMSVPSVQQTSTTTLTLMSLTILAGSLMFMMMLHSDVYLATFQFLCWLGSCVMLWLLIQCITNTWSWINILVAQCCGCLCSSCWKAKLHMHLYSFGVCRIFTHACAHVFVNFVCV